MVIRDTNIFRSLLALRGLHQQIDIAKKFHTSENSVTRWFKGKPMHRGTAERISEFLERDSGELFVDKSAPCDVLGLR